MNILISGASSDDSSSDSTSVEVQHKGESVQHVRRLRRDVSSDSTSVEVQHKGESVEHVRRLKRDVCYQESSDEELCSENGSGRYAKKIKQLEDKGILDDFRLMETLRQKIRYKLMSPKQRAKSNDQSKLRMEKKRQRDKEELEKKKRLRSYEENQEETRNKRAYWREKQAERRKRIKLEDSCSNSPVGKDEHTDTPKLKRSRSAPARTQVVERKEEKSLNDGTPKGKRSTSPKFNRQGFSDYTPDALSDSKRCASRRSTPAKQKEVEMESQRDSSTKETERTESRQTPSASQSLIDSRNLTAKRMARKRIGFPRSPRKFISTLLDAMKHATPKKKKLLKKYLPSPKTTHVHSRIVETLKEHQHEDGKKMTISARRGRLFCANIAKRADRDILAS